MQCIDADEINDHLPFFADLPPPLLFDEPELLFAEPPLLAEEEPPLPDAELVFAELDFDAPLLDAELPFAEEELPRPPELFPAEVFFELLDAEPLFEEPEEALFDAPLLEPDELFLDAPPEEPRDEEPPFDDELFEELVPPEEERDDEPLFAEPLLLLPEPDFLEEPPDEARDFDADCFEPVPDDVELLAPDADLDRPPAPLADLPSFAPVAFAIFCAVSPPAPASAAESMSAAASLAPSMTLDTVSFLVFVAIGLPSFLTKATCLRREVLSGGLQNVF